MDIQINKGHRQPIILFLQGYLIILPWDDEGVPHKRRAKTISESQIIEGLNQCFAGIDEQP
jgi:hypothetical protein